MPSFIQLYAYNNKPVDVQIALYAQGLNYHDSRSRKGGLPSLSNSAQVIKDIAQTERLRIYNDKVKAALAATNAKTVEEQQALARALRLRVTEEFLQIHDGVPKFFSFGEVDRMNLLRPKDDQIELMPSRLPKHHCAFPKCPFYLKSLATDKDKQLNRRGGLYRHIKYFFLSEPPEYVKGFHMIAATTMDYKMSKEEYIKIVLHKVKQNQPHKEFHSSSQEKEIVTWIGFLYDSAIKK